MTYASQNYDALRRAEHLLESTRHLFDFWKQNIAAPNPGEEGQGFDEISGRYFRLMGVPQSERDAVRAVTRELLTRAGLPG
jgi:hypothetical protein